MGLLPSFRLRVRPLPVGTRAVEHHSAQPPLKAKACSDYQAACVCVYERACDIRMYTCTCTGKEAVAAHRLTVGDYARIIAVPAQR